MNVWLFTGADGVHALTLEGDGLNLPSELGPWIMVRAVKLEDDNPDEQEATALIGEHGFCCFD